MNIHVKKDINDNHNNFVKLDIKHKYSSNIKIKILNKTKKIIKHVAIVICNISYNNCKI